MNEIKVNLENLTKTEQEQLLALVDKANKPKAWKPEEHEQYFIVQINGKVNYFYWENDRSNNGAYDIGNCFKTREQAEWMVEHLKVKAELQRFADEHNEFIDWSNEEQRKWMLQFEYDRNLIECVFGRSIQYADTVYFSSEEIAKQAIDFIGKDRLKKYYFGIEE